MLSSLVTSAGIAMAFNLAATASRRSTLREARITSAPSRLASSAVASPIPEEPPTTTTFLPVSILLSPRYLVLRFRQFSTRHCEGRQRRSNPALLCRSGLLRGACHRARIRATRWLAMTGREYRPELPSRRLVSHSDAGLALSKSGKLPNAGAAGIDIGGAIDPHAFHAAGARHRGEVRIVARASGWIVEVGGEFAAAEVAALQAADRGIGVVVPDHPDHRQIIFDRRSQHVGMHEERAVAAYRYAGTVGGC